MVTSQRKTVETDRAAESLPDLQAGIPLLLQIDTSLDVDKLRQNFDFEIVAEEEDGYVIVASEDVDLTKFHDAVTGFAGSVHGTGVIDSGIDATAGLRIRYPRRSDAFVCR